SSESTSYSEAIKIPHWIEAMNNENKSSGEIERYKARLVTKGFSQREGFDYLETFSLVVKMSIVSGFVMSKFDYSLFTKKHDKVFIALLVYVDDIVITRNDVSEIKIFKLFLKSKFQIKDLGKLKYFLGIEVLENDEGICLNQRKYCIELLYEYGLLATKYVDTPLPENTTLNHIESDDDHLLDSIGNYQKLIGKLIYLTNTRPAISYAVHCLSQYMHAPLVSYLDVALRVLRCLKVSPRSGIQIYKKGHLKLRDYIDTNWAGATRSSAKVDYRSMASATCEFCFANCYLVFHEKSKHFEINVHLVREKVSSGVIKIEKIHTSQQIVDVLTKALDIE
ncbi:ribonuclease H-like domain-containing protein, partial [Tanacetum coccineum]